MRGRMIGRGPCAQGQLKLMPNAEAAAWLDKCNGSSITLYPRRSLGHFSDGDVVKHVFSYKPSAGLCGSQFEDPTDEVKMIRERVDLERALRSGELAALAKAKAAARLDKCGSSTDQTLEPLAFCSDSRVVPMCSLTKLMWVAV
jgi:hypothetical protein